jgi:hypothetical protein
MVSDLTRMELLTKIYIVNTFQLYLETNAVVDRQEQRSQLRRARKTRGLAHRLEQ